MSDLIEFQPFPKMARYSRQSLVTEKIDGTNACIFITPSGAGIMAGSRNRWITPSDDNYDFAKWVEENRTELLKLGPGRHYGEWWGRGIQRNYGLTERRFSLFNAMRWHGVGDKPREFPTADPRVLKKTELAPECCHVVPILGYVPFGSHHIEECVENLRRHGSLASPGFTNPEGVVVYHVAGNVGFKKTLDGDEAKGNQ